MSLKIHTRRDVVAQRRLYPRHWVAYADGAFISGAICEPNSMSCWATTSGCDAAR